MFINDPNQRPKKKTQALKITLKFKKPKGGNNTLKKLSNLLVE